MKRLLIILLLIMPLAAFGQLDTINVGTSANSGTGESLRSAMLKTNNQIKAWNAIQMYNISLAEMSILNGATVSTTELNLLDGVTAIENYSTENYGATGTGNIVLSTGPTLTTVTITDVLRLTPTANPPSGATEGMIYMDTDHHLYVHNGTTWVQLDN